MKTLVLFLVFLTGCVSVADLPGRKAQGTKQTIEAPASESFSIARAVLESDGFEIKESIPSKGYLAARVYDKLLGETVAAVWIERNGAASSVTVLFRSPLFVSLTPETFFARMRERAGL